MATKDAQGNLHDDNNGRFTNKQGVYQERVNDRIKWAKENGVELPLNADGTVDDLKLQKLKRSSLSKKEFAVWYQKLGEIKRGGHVDTMSNSDKLIPIGNKIVVTSGTYEDPKAKIVFEFESEEKMFENLEKLGRENEKQFG